jgi:hypothetical protein
MIPITQKEIDKETEYLEKQKALLKVEREKIMQERSKIYYDRKQIDQEQLELNEERIRIDNLRATLSTELKKVNIEFENAKKEEILKLKKAKENETAFLESELQKERIRLDKLREQLETEMIEANLVIREKVKKDLDTLLENDRLELDKLRAEIAEQIAIEEAKLNDIKRKNLI